MSMSMKTDPKFEAAYDRAALRSEILSLFWGIISERKAREKYTLQNLAEQIGSSKHEVSRWFNGDPNWTINTVASIARALGVRLRVEAVDSQGRVFSPNGLQVEAFKQRPSMTLSSGPIPTVTVTKNTSASNAHASVTTAA